MRKILLLLLTTILSVSITYAQNGGKRITGKLLDAQTKEPLIGATVTIKGTTDAAAVALNGTFKITVPADGSTTLVFSYIGYVSKELVVSTPELGTITLDPTSSSIKEVVVSANASLAIDRQTPIAVSSVGKVYIEEKGAGAEFPELLKATPGVTVTRSGGGYGDSRVAIRGFNSSNVALLINGLPVNDVEAGKIFWNDWAGLSDVTTSMQVQRGLGASKVAVPSLGGTINITTMSTEVNESGTISQSIGSYGALKTALSYSSGLSSKGWATSFLLSKSTGDGNAEGLYYTGYSYFANISKILSPSQTLSFNFMGASQNHGQRYTYQTINTYRAAPQGAIRFNSDYGYLDGQVLSAEQNFYNKPLASINHNWQINEKSSLSTVLYASYGTGAARFITGTQSGLTIGGVNATAPRSGDAYAPIDFNAITKTNQANADGTASTYFQDVENDHKQYGLLSTYKTKLGDNINLLGGVDLRSYIGDHFYKVNDLLGGSYIIDKGDLNNPNKHAVVGDKINRNYEFGIVSEGAYLQTEYAKNDLSAFVTVAANNTSNKRTDYFNYLTTDANRESKWVNFLGYQAKGGANYNLDSHSNVFVNVGYIQRAPLVATIFLNNKNDLNKDAKAEKLLSYELGYGFTSSAFSANLNLYRSTYKDRAKVLAAPANTDGTINTYNISGINELHQGVELDMKYRPIKDVTFSGMLSVGDYHYLTNTTGGQVTNDIPDSKAVAVPALYLKGIKIGDFGSSAASNAQTTAALGLDINVLPQVKIGGNYNYYGNFIASYDPSKLTATAGFDKTQFNPYKLPNYQTLDLNIVYRFKFAGLDASFIGNVYNVLNTQYFTEGYEATPSTDPDVTRLSRLGVNYGNGRLYMTTVKIKF